MIVTSVLIFLKALLSGFVQILPTVAFPSEITDAINGAIGYANTAGFLLPIDTFFQVLGIYLTLHLAIVGWKTAHWLYSLVRGHRITK